MRFLLTSVPSHQFPSAQSGLKFFEIFFQLLCVYTGKYVCVLFSTSLHTFFYTKNSIDTHCWAHGFCTCIQEYQYEQVYIYPNSFMAVYTHPRTTFYPVPCTGHVCLFSSCVLRGGTAMTNVWVLNRDTLGQKEK